MDGYFLAERSMKTRTGPTGLDIGLESALAVHKRVHPAC